VDKIFEKYGVDKYFNGQYGHNYSFFYNMVLSNIKKENINMLEIGIASGRSLKMWDEYFKNSNIYGWDIIDCFGMDTDNIKTFIVDQGNEEQINRFLNSNKIEFDFIIDDGSHMFKDQCISLFNLFPVLKSGGVYIIEDMWHETFDCFLKLGYKKDYYGLVDTSIKNLIKKDRINYVLDNLICCQKNNVIFSSGEDKSDHQFYVFYKK
jgi:hypothetical protein